MGERSREQVATELLRCAVAWEPGARVLGNVTAHELAAYVICDFTSCPLCGAEPWVDIDCELCRVCSDVAAEVDRG